MTAECTLNRTRESAIETPVEVHSCLLDHFVARARLYSLRRLCARKQGPMVTGKAPLR